MTLNIGWIGCGTHATQMLLPQMVRHDVRIAALCDVAADRLVGAGRQFGVTKLFSDVAELIASPGIDAVGMAVGPQQHLEFAQLTLRRGLPVFLEKPPAPDAKGAEDILRASEKAGKPVLVGFMKRYSAGNAIARNIVASGRFGPVLGLTGYYMTAPGYFAGNVDYTGFFLHHCVHYMDLVSHLVSPVREMSVRKIEHAPGRLLFHVSIGFDSGAIGTVAMGTVQSRGAPVERIELMGDHNRIEIDNVINVTWHRDAPFKVSHPEATLADESDTLSWRPNFTAAANEDPKGYHALLADVVPALGGAATEAPDIRAGVVALQRLEQLRVLLTL